MVRRLLVLAALNACLGVSAGAQMVVPPEIEQAVSRGTRTIDGRPGEAYWQFYPKYRISAELVPQEESCLGSSRSLSRIRVPITWTRSSSDWIKTDLPGRTRPSGRLGSSLNRWLLLAEAPSLQSSSPI